MNRRLFNRRGAIVVACLVLAGCSLEPPKSNLMLLNESMLEMRDLLASITDEAGVKQNLDKIEDLSEKMRGYHAKIEEARQKSSGGMMSVVSQRDEKQSYGHLLYSVEDSISRIAEADPAAGELLHKATEGVLLPLE